MRIVRRYDSKNNCASVAAGIKTQRLRERTFSIFAEILAKTFEIEKATRFSVEFKASKRSDREFVSELRLELIDNCFSFSFLSVLSPMKL